jgi:subtilisin-like proprotein convertase family protein
MGIQFMRVKPVQMVVLAALTAMLATAATVSTTFAAVPQTVVLEGVLQSKGGGPAADGDYDFVFALYGAKTSGAALWTEKAKIKVTGGGFSHILGSTTPLEMSKLASAKVLWLGAKVGADPELPREKVHSVLYANFAGTANGLACSGCVKSSMLAFDGDFNLKNKTLTAAKVISAGDVVAGGTVSAKSFTGDGTKLTGIPHSGVKCSNKGEVVKGINPDGTLLCVLAMDPNGLPPDGLNEISNGQLTNQFIDQTTMNVAVDIPDNAPNGLSSKLLFPDIGLAQELAVTYTISGHKGETSGKTGIGDLVITLADPAGGTYMLRNKTGTANSITQSFPPTKTIKGALSDWHGKNPKGTWTLKIVDDKFLDNKIDGKLVSWSIKIQTLSNKKVATTGDHHVQGTLFGAVQFKNMDADPFKCDASRSGYMYFNSKFKAIHVCEGKEWVPINLRPVGSQINPGLSCKDVWTRRPGAVDGKYFIDPDGATGGQTAVQLNCDMKGGGWTQITQSTNYPTKVYAESSKYYGFKYEVPDAFIIALHKISTNFKQTWKCAGKGIGSQTKFKGWSQSNYNTGGSGTCWHANNSSIVSGSGTHTSASYVPVRAWESVDCGDGSEYCSYNVGHAFFK